MRIFQINGGVFGSTGRIMFGIAEMARQQGHEVLCAAPITSTNRRQQPKDPYIKIGSYYGRCLNVLLARLTGLEGHFAVLPTLKLLAVIKRFAPDVLHLHSIHNSYLNLSMLFRFIKKHKIRVVWTLHDCWAFTGHCPHYEMVGCEQWKTNCKHCSLYRDYPISYIDNARIMHKCKKKWFLGIEDLTIVTPSQWLVDQVGQSFLKEYPIRVINNGIDTSIFKPTPSDFREKYHCKNKRIVLGVAFEWGIKKGLDVFIELAKRLDERFQIVLVGTNDQVDQQLPDNIISIHKTQDQHELAKIYTAADVFANPTREDNYPTVNLEAVACGTPVLTFKSGGSPECICENSGVVVEKDDVDAFEREILRITAAEWQMDRVPAMDYRETYKKVLELYGEMK